MSSPLISVLTPSFNQGRFLSDAMQSIAAQGTTSFEHIVVDGGSTDNTVQLLRDVSSAYPLVWVSEPDRGLYDALNKALALSRGEWIGWLNCDDVFPEGTFRRFLERVTREEHLEAVCGDARVVRSGSKTDYSVLASFKHYRGSVLDASRENLRVTHLNCCFFHRQLLSRVGNFDIGYRIVGDRDYMFRIMRQRPASAHIGAVSCEYRAHDTSLTMGAGATFAKQGIKLPPTHPQILEIQRLCEVHRRDERNPRPIRAWCNNALGAIHASRAAASILHGELGAFSTHATAGLGALPLTWPFRFARSLARQGVDKVRAAASS